MPADITIDPQEWTRLIKLLGTVDATKVAKRATKDVAKAVRTRVARRVKEQFTLKYGDVLRGIKAQNVGQTSATVNIGGRRRSLRSFKGSPKKPRHEMARLKSGKLRKSVFRYEIERGKKRTAGDVFVQRSLRAAKEAIPFKRVGRGRYPVTVPKGPSVPAIWQAKNKNRVAREVIVVTRDMLQQRIRGQTFRILQQQMRTMSRQAQKAGA